MVTAMNTLQMRPNAGLRMEPPVSDPSVPAVS